MSSIPDVRPVQRFQALDGTLWESADAAEDRSRLLRDIERALAPLGPRRELDEREYVQHTPTDVWTTMANLVDLARVRYPKMGALQENYDFRTERSGGGLSFVFGRILEGTPLSTAWGRLDCIDERGREWQQPYFVHHPPTSAIKVIP